ncbi:two-partner secretion domain-containing protein [Moraxella oculi]|uniref:DUF637 domain-containing protein n=1 Tax=Moraxella oculi TaxID=2940516 RepID=A0ABW8U3P4_9GAMM
MNRNRFRVIFSKTLARLVVVSEKSKSDGKSSGFGGFSPSDSDPNSNQDTTLSSSHCTKTILYTAIITSLLGISSTSLANIKADPAATNNQKPIIAAAKNSTGQTVPVVQIQTPVQGISHNKYTKFDVNAQGAILNNVRTGAQTQLAGAVAGNPFLKQGEAHTIINEVRSNKASQLTGTLEVAGQKANVIIANPSGINVAGANFINVHEATLSTGHIAHQIEQGRFSHNITQGSITINAPKSTANSNNNTSNNPNNTDKQIIGLGETHTADYVNLYAKAVSINAQIQAEHAITAVAGSNQISDTGHITPNPNQNSQATTTNTNKNPTTAIDVKLLGGMSAGSITLIGTDKGVGVNTAGALTAKHSIHISSDGKITHTGKSQAQTGGINLASNTAIEIKQHNSPNNNQAAAQNSNLQANTDIKLSAPTIIANQANITSKTGDISTNAKQNLTFTNSTLTAGKNLEVIIANTDSNQTNKPKQKHIATLTNNTLTAKGHITTANLHGDLTHTDNKLVASGNISSFAGLNQTLTNTSIISKQNSQVGANQNLNFTSSQISSDQHTAIHTKANQTSTNSQFGAKGVVSDVVGGAYTITGNVNHQGGAVLIEADSLTINNQDKLNISTTNSPLLSAHNQTRHLSGDISVQTNKDLTLTNTTKLTQTGNQGDISLTSKQGNLTLTNQLNAPKGSISLQGQSVALTAANISAQQDINVYATDGSVQIDGVRGEFVNQKSTQTLPHLQQQKQQLEQKINAIKNNPAYIKDKQQLDIAIGNWYDEMDLDDCNTCAAWSHVDELAKQFAKKYQLKAEFVALHDYGAHIKISEPYAQELDKLNRKILLVSQNTSGYEHTPSSLTTQTSDISIHAKDTIIASGANISAGGNITLNAQGFAPNSYEFNSQAGKNSQNLNTSIILDGLQNHYEVGSQGSNHHRIIAFSTPTTLTAGKDINITATAKQPNTHLVLQGSQIAAGGNLTIAANHHLLLDAAIDYEYGYDKTTHRHGKWYKRKYTTTTTTNEWTDADTVSLTANNIRLQTHADKANSHINIYAADMTTTGGDIRLISTGNINLYALTNQHSNEQHSHTKKKLLGIRYNTTDNHNQRQQITALPATLVANYINSRSEGDTTLEGTRFDYLSGASFYAGGKINLLAAISTLQEQARTDSNSVVWQSMQNTGRIEQSALLPSFTGPTNPTFEAKGGLNVQIPISEKDVQKRQLKDEIITLASQSEYSYLNELINRDDINWQQVILSNDEWNYKQQGLTPAGAAIVAIAVAYATGGLGSELSASIVSSATNAGIAASTAGTLGAMSSAAFGSLVSTASISLINNQGDIKATLKELGSKQNIKQLTFAIASAGIGSKINQTLSKSLGVGDIANSHNFSHKISKGIANATSTALLESAIYGTSLEKSLIKNLRGEVANAVASEIFTDYVKPLDKDTLIDNITHKLAAGMTGCLSAKVAGNRCEAGSIGAVVGEMVGDYQVDDPNTLTQAQKDKLINQAKLIAGITAAYAGEDVNVAAGVAAEAVENNALVKFGDIESFRLQYTKFCSPEPSAACDSIIHQWKYISYDHAGMTSQEIAEWEKGVTQIIEHYNRQCTDNACRNHLRSQKYRYMIEHAGTPRYLYQLESSLITYIHGPRAAIATAGYQIAGSVVEAYDAVARRSVRGGNHASVKTTGHATTAKSNNAGSPKLSSPNPIHIKGLRSAYEDVISGKGTPNLDRNGIQKIYQGRENPNWKGATEWLVPNSEGRHHRILKMPNGRMGYVIDHNYNNIRPFPAPWYPDGGVLAKPVR